MRGYYGSYAFDDNAIVIASNSKLMINRGGQPYSQKYSYKISGFLAGSSQSDITQKMNALDTALAKPYQNFRFYQDSGSLSATYLDNGSSITGVKVVDGPNYTSSKGAEYVTMREFNFTVEAEYALSNTSSLLLYFTETLDIVGGGPRFVIKNAVVGPPQKQQVNEATACYITQTGMAEGYTTSPSLQPPIFGIANLLDTPDIKRVSPERMGGGFQGEKVYWTYRFGFTSPVTGVPNRWIR